MIVKLYVDWESQEILNETEYREAIWEKTNEFICDEDVLSEFLCEVKHIEVVEAFNLGEEERKTLMDEFKAWCEQEASDWVDENVFDIVEVEV